jgi:two-component system, OmpR family, sensor histidine kinase BaeS
MMRSLTFKWIATLLVASLVGVLLVGLFAYRTTVNEFDRLRVEQAEAEFVEDAVAYYSSNHSWDGFDSRLREQQPAASEDQGRPPPFQQCALADANGIVVVGSGPFQIGERVREHELDEGTPIIVDGERVGTTLVAAPPPGPDPREQRYLDRTTGALLVGAIGASSVALLIGILLSRHFMRPLTELTQAITAMQQGDLNQQVEVRTQDELGTLAQAFNQMSAQVHRANQLRQQMTADIAHDLRTPLMVITGYLEALRDGTLQPTPERYEAMNHEAVLLKRLVEDLRTLSLADAGELKLVYQSVQPRELLEQVKQSFEPIADEQRVALQVLADENLPELQVDRERMVQVLANLVSNALRYTPARGSVTLRARKQQDGVELVVADTGSGIPADKLPNVFERFYRTDESRQENQGESGLGLAIAKSIVEAHHGTIAAESQVGVGTSMKITLRPATHFAIS